MEYIIDGYNLIKSSFLKKYESEVNNSAVEALLSVISGYRRKHPSVMFTVVFDGFIDMRYPDRKIRLLFSHDLTADEVIRQDLERNPDKNRMKTVVSDDREVQVCGKILGSSIMNIREFLDIIAPPAPRKMRGRDASKSSMDINKFQIEAELKDFYKKGDINQ
ncbi:MAG TPA: NYN domain-containing protein [bacterium]|nr:NYN domain-containing protein [bacterium]